MYLFFGEWVKFVIFDVSFEKKYNSRVGIGSFFVWFLVFGNGMGIGSRKRVEMLSFWIFFIVWDFVG